MAWGFIELPRHLVTGTPPFPKTPAIFAIPGFQTEWPLLLQEKKNNSYCSRFGIFSGLKDFICLNIFDISIRLEKLKFGENNLCKYSAFPKWTCDCFHCIFIGTVKNMSVIFGFDLVYIHIILVKKYSILSF